MAVNICTKNSTPTVVAIFLFDIVLARYLISYSAIIYIEDSAYLIVCAIYVGILNKDPPPCYKPSATYRAW